MGCLLLCFLLSGPLHGQTSLIDSLEKQLPDTRLHDTVRIGQLNVLAREYTYISASKATLYAQRALDWSIRIGYKRGQAYAYRNLASSYSSQEYFYCPAGMSESRGASRLNNPSRCIWASRVVVNTPESSPISNTSSGLGNCPFPCSVSPYALITSLPLRTMPMMRPLAPGPPTY